MVVFGWPAVVLSVALAACGILSRKPVLLLVAAVVAVPFAYYISGAENWIAVVGPAIPLTLAAGAYAVKHRRFWAAWGLLVPLVGSEPLVSGSCMVIPVRTGLLRAPRGHPQ